MKYFVMMSLALLSTAAFAHEGHGLAESLPHSLMHLTLFIACLGVSIAVVAKVIKHLSKRKDKKSAQVLSN